METRGIIHLEYLGADGNPVHEYFGSASSLFDKHSEEELGITRASLNNYFSKSDGNMKTTKTNYIIRRGQLYVKPTTRGRKKEE